MNTNRLWVIGSITVMIVVLVAGWFLGIEPNLAAAAKNDADRLALETQTNAQLSQIAVLTEENKDLASVENVYKELQRSIPASPNTSAFIASLDDLAASTGVQVVGFTVGASESYTVPESAVAVPTPSDTATPSPTTTEAPAPPVAVGSVAATSPLITPDNFVGITVGVDLKGAYQSVLSYIKGLQSGPRLVLVTGINSVADVEGSSTDVTAHIDAMIYVLKKAV